MSAFKSFSTWAATSTVAHVAFGFLAMGGWAVFANRAHPLPDALQAGFVQGVISGSLTLVLKKALEWMNVRLSGAAFGELRQAPPDASLSLSKGSERRLVALILPPVVTAATILAILVGAHTLAGTPEILATIAVPFTVSTSYACLYNWKLVRERRANG